MYQANKYKTTSSTTSLAQPNRKPGQQEIASQLSITRHYLLVQQQDNVFGTKLTSIPVHCVVSCALFSPPVLFFSSIFFSFFGASAMTNILRLVRFRKSLYVDKWRIAVKRGVFSQEITRPATKVT